MRPWEQWAKGAPAHAHADSNYLNRECMQSVYIRINKVVIYRIIGCSLVLFSFIKMKDEFCRDSSI